MIDLDEQLRGLAEDLELPSTSPEDDLARGRARLRRRNLGALGVGVTTAAVIGTSVVVLSGGLGDQGATSGFAGSASSTPQAPGTPRPDTGRTATTTTIPQAVETLHQQSSGLQVDPALDGYRDVLREHLDPTGTRIQRGPITNEQGGDHSLGTKLDWNGGGMLQVAVGRSLEGVQFFCDGACTTRSVPGARKALVLTSPGQISVAVFQDDGDVVALTASTSFGNNGTSTDTLGVTVDDLLGAATDPRLDLPDPSAQPSGAVGTQ